MTNNRVLVVAAHADDEALGCAGTLAKHTASGDQVSIIFMTDGVSSRYPSNTEQSQARSDAKLKAMELLGITNIYQHSFPDNKMDSVPLLDIVQVVEQTISDIQPTIIYTHFASDLNIDHRVTHNAVMTACRPQKTSSVKTILSFEVLSSTEWNSPSQTAFTPQYIVDITNFWAVKEKVLNCYQEELRVFPHSRSLQCIEALATLRGATHGLNKAEAFFVERIIN
ncbi:PIG-L deacetylase family protein [Psychromonas ossibalaenae]|uniref:PIG-L deacetylase family protein n=1 Tax=Psychromonas ossibalaenae TaxID=444922 RepID=UPI00037374E2|nr:PIG-L family deacetylase [Psychromonas ossibalaenae]